MLTSACLQALVLLVGGIAPWLLLNPQSKLIGQVALPLTTGYRSVAWSGAPIYAAVAALLALAAGYLLARHGTPRRVPSAGLMTMRTFLEMDWLYSSAERSLAWAENIIARGAALLERGSASLGWVLLWILVGVFFLTGR